MKIEVEINEYDIIERIASKFIRDFGFDKLKSEIVNNLSKQIKSDIISSPETQNKINKVVLAATASLTGRINQKSEEIIQRKLDELFTKKIVLNMGE